MSSVEIYKPLEEEVTASGEWKIKIDQARPSVHFNISNIEPTNKADAEHAEERASLSLTWQDGYDTSEIYAPGLTAADLRDLYKQDMLLLLDISECSDNPFESVSFTYLLLNKTPQGLELRFPTPRFEPEAEPLPEPVRVTPPPVPRDLTGPVVDNRGWWARTFGPRNP